MKINKLMQVALGVMLVTGLGALISLAYGFDYCGKSSDECLQDKIEHERQVTISQDSNFEQQIKAIQDVKIKFDNDQSAKINGYKEKQTQGWGAEQKKKGQLQNVFPEMLKQSPISFIPEAKADITIDSEITLNTEKAVSINPDRYTSVLATYNAPYQGVPIERYCNEAGLVQWRCDIMVGIAQQESQMGKDFHCIQQTLEHSIELGQNYYHNPSGLSDINVHYKNYATTGKKNADFQGCFIRKFDSWDAFWQFMPKSFMDPDMRYYVGNWSNVRTLSGIWVNGHSSQPNQSWIDTVVGVVNKI